MNLFEDYLQLCLQLAGIFLQALVIDPKSVETACQVSDANFKLAAAKDSAVLLASPLQHHNTLP